MNDESGKKLVIIGASHAGSQLAFSARQLGWTGPIELIGDEDVAPYHRPPLSKDYLTGGKALENILLKPVASYAKSDITLRIGLQVNQIDRSAKRCTLSNGKTVGYDKLALAVGAKVRKVPIKGSDKAGVFYLRTIADIDGIRDHTGEGQSAVIIGGGYIGLETAASLRKLGMRVTVLEMMPKILQRVIVAQPMTDFFMRVHQEEGVAIVTNAQVEEIGGDKRAETVVCANGQTFAADLVIIGAGILPNTELAEEAGIKVDNGIVVDEFCRTNDADIVAVGDCTFNRNLFYPKPMRMESVQNAVDQAKTAAATLCEQAKPYNCVVWFWSDQYDVKLQIVGLYEGFTSMVIRGNPAQGRKFSIFYLRNKTLIAVDAINSPDAFVFGRKHVGAPMNFELERLGDESTPLKELTAQAKVG
ncbi:MAG: FAD-dependent oxidoreductase [Gammaproteobacteria bacterium]|nr:FAD-dependent oxidoreductase [Gammaproteobacteria bacterium]MBT8152303.1 FAD-dependent oxidoreductase [Gammaproteobacteria bacterium]NND38638.1 FAD-dependent oxidoreductase [Pseudomonadales bacterium]NNM11716.1 FAD-dependent oxidoreductase [Pseudomonadales bacterium]RZV56213.1 MAG: pyridine nucleotide-disulfide oxidoreductase [Pseudomonadales bacterium]